MQITLRDFAKENGVSYEAVRQQVNRYAAELEGHIHKQGRTQYLDDVAVSFLNSKRAQNPMIVYDKDRDEELQELRGKVNALQEKVIAAQELALASQGALVEAQAARMALAAAEDQRDQMAAAAEKAHQEAAEARLREETALSKAEELRRALEAAEARGKALKERSWWERLTRKGE